MLRTINVHEQKEIETIVKILVGESTAIYNFGDDCDFVLLPCKGEKTLMSVLELKETLVEGMAREFGGTVEEYRFRMKVAKGISKLVIVDREKDYAIKIPLKGQAYRTVEGDFNFYPFHEDYCAIEENIYQTLPYSVRELFAETRYELVVNKYIEVYVQEQIEETFGCSWRNDGSLTIADLPKDERIPMESFKSKGYVWELDQQFIYDVLVRYGAMTVEAMMDTIYNENINDLHCDNYGYTADELPKIFDYSGFNE